MDYTLLTNDTSYQASLLTAIGENIGDNNDFAPAAQASWEANDDQAYWVYSALSKSHWEHVLTLYCHALSHETRAFWEYKT